MNDNLDSKLRWDEIAADVGMDPFAFGRRFKLSTGMTPHDYVIRCRLRRGMLLLQSTLSLADIALEVGLFLPKSLHHAVSQAPWNHPRRVPPLRSGRQRLDRDLGGRAQGNDLAPAADSNAALCRRRHYGAGSGVSAVGRRRVLKGSHFMEPRISIVSRSGDVTVRRL